MNFDNMRWVIGKDSLEVIPGRNTPAGLAGKPPLKCTYSVDDTQSPAHFNWTLGDGDRKLMINAVYELKGDVLRVCFAPRGQPRPDGFETKGKRCSAYEFRRSPKDNGDANALKYTISVEGTKGVKLRMLLVTKPLSKSGPTRESKVITVPFQQSFKAQSFYVWFDTLEGGASGKDGDRINGTYKVNGDLQGGGFDATIKKENKKSCGFGNL